jgi:DNA adenine methylase
MLSSPLRYPGGKARLFPYFSELVQHNGLIGAEYCEPYAGGAGLAIRLLTSGYVSRIRLNDIDASVHAFWNSVLHHNDELCTLIATTPITIGEWYRQRDIWRAVDITDTLRLGFSAFFLNRTNRSGIIEGAGPIGGYAQAGTWKIDVRFIRDTQIRNIRSLSRYAEQISISNDDAFDFIVQYIGKPNVLTYLDPPYFVKGRKLYKNFYCPEDHIKIASELCDRRNSNWIVTYDDVPAIRQAYASFDPIPYHLNYSAGRKAIGSEIMFLSDSLGAPETGAPLQSLPSRSGSIAA